MSTDITAGEYTAENIKILKDAEVPREILDFAAERHRAFQDMDPAAVGADRATLGRAAVHAWLRAGGRHLPDVP